MRLNALLAPILLFVTLVMSGCQNESSTDYIKLSEGEFSFFGDNNEPKVIEVFSNLPWEAKLLDAPWLEISEITSNTLTLTAKDNDTNIERTTKIIITAGDVIKEVTVYQVQKEDEFSRYRTFHNQFQMGAVISPSGKYIGGLKLELNEEGNGFLYYPTIIDIATEERVAMGPYPPELMTLYGPMAMTDQGELILHDESLVNYCFDMNKDEYRIISEFDGAMPSVSCVSADGSVWVGYVHSVSKKLSMPMKWVNGVPELLPLPEERARGGAFFYGGQARGISADGSVIYGTEWENNDSAMIYWDKQGNVHPVGKREITGTIMRPVWDDNGIETMAPYNLLGFMISWSGKTNVSETGKYIAGTYKEEKLASDGKSIVATYFAAFYNTETDETTIFRDLSNTSGMAVADDGIGFIGTPVNGVTGGIVVDIENETVLGTSQEWALKEYGIHLPDGYISYMCAGGEVFMGMSVFLGGPMPDNSYWYVAPPIKK